MQPPLISYVTWNRLGLTARNLPVILQNPHEFEMHIVDNHSRDNTREFLSTLKDKRIRSITCLDANMGPIYATNLNLSRRAPDQFFITIDNDVNIHTPDWQNRFLRAFEAFSEAGLLGAVSKNYYEQNRQPLLKCEKNGISYLRSIRGFVEGCCECLHPRLLSRLGYWNEESCAGDMEMCHRINHYTDFTAGFLPDIEIDQVQTIRCSDCAVRDLCRLYRTGESCFDIYRRSYSNPQFRSRFGWKYRAFIRELERGKRGVFCPSIHDMASMAGHVYDRVQAEENFMFYMKNGDG